MKLLTVFLFLITVSTAFSQQNLFNIPSGDITRDGKFFYQHQINIYSDEFESKSHLVYGLGGGWDIGVNLVGKGAYFSPDWRVSYNDNPDRGALYPFLMPTLQKQFSLADNLDVNLGTQVGFNISSKLSNKELAFFNYGIGVFPIGKVLNVSYGIVEINGSNFALGGNANSTPFTKIFLFTICNTSPETATQRFK